MTLDSALRADPQRYLRIVNGWIQENPNNHDAYFGRHFAWMKLGEPQRALDDLNKVIELNVIAWHFCRAARSTGTWASTKRP